MSLLVTARELEARRTLIARGELAGLAAELRRELDPFVACPPDVPREKAMLSRQGGRCSLDGALLRFDPYDPRHVCSQCGQEYAGGLHDRFRLYWYQLWIAERVLHAALLGVLLDDVAAREAAVTMLDRYTDQYLRYPNADNVLGPSRVFFSTYLESIWLLQLSLALDFLETGAPSSELSSLGSRVRDRLIAPSAALIASYDEGLSNRQVWNNAALMAAARMLDDRELFDRALRGRSGLHGHLVNALLSDGSWYEGENYHFFAHRGLWYGALFAAAAGQPLPSALENRFLEGFAAPFRTVLPDLTFPSRRDSQYAVSVRQPRFAESCELGLALRGDVRLLGMLARLYDPSVPRGEVGRRASSADVERNLGAAGLRREDLSWRSLLMALPTLPPLVPQPIGSDLLPAQGLGMLRRDQGALYVSLDYGHSGGGHGHPDRLNLTLMDGERRWFDDPGTGSYVDPTLHWYRSTLAHMAPLVDGSSQARVHGALIAFHDDDRAGAGWVSAQAELLPGVIVRRTIITLADYVIDELTWEGAEPHELALPIHGVRPAAPRHAEPATITGGSGAEDGFTFLQDGCRLDAGDGTVVTLGANAPDGRSLDGWQFFDEGTTLWSATAPGPPGDSARRPLLLLRHTAQRGAFVGVWSWRTAVRSVEREGAVLVVERHDGSRHRHRRFEHGWLVEMVQDGDVRLVELGGRVSRLHADDDNGSRTTPPRSSAVPVAYTLPARVELGEPHYRRSEVSWQGAGAPRATVTITRPTPGTVEVEVDVPSSHRLFVPLVMENHLDNEPASINGDSIQLYAMAGTRSTGVLLVPEGTSVGARRVDGWGNDLAVDARWRLTSTGYRLVATIHIDGRTREFFLDVIVNEAVPGRARRRGQLVLSGAKGEFVYLQGDRHDPARLGRYSLSNA